MGLNSIISFKLFSMTSVNLFSIVFGWRDLDGGWRLTKVKLVYLHSSSALAHYIHKKQTLLFIDRPHLVGFTALASFLFLSYTKLLKTPHLIFTLVSFHFPSLQTGGGPSIDLSYLNSEY
ncbi:hypothetical protein L6164_012502 [Bauhinia variegata]|uniref:Uncharacterized protein n=1 Tax=Bauhinia variegata TaxID=167791 RepID=A0ACB9P994_BAUVA|nr:hypothetical protein L6164_012502 [Bauhinia variegata]